MSIDVKNVTKRYGSQKALDNVSFSIPAGEVVGFLGPNGAGKSTMMKIITCFIPQNEGSVSVCNFDVNENPIDVRKNVGYLPEHNPLYLDMYVKEYLEFMAGLQKTSKKRVPEMIKMTGLTSESHKKIGALSKGYRQRVGLAQALIHDPKVLILDEPTTGLDPNQLTEIRGLIKEIGKEKTVMLSTHIMQEVEAICDRVIIINKGKIVADKPTEEIQQLSGTKQIVTVEFDGEVVLAELKRIKGVIAAENIKGNIWKVESSSKKDLRPEIFNFAVSKSRTILQVKQETQSLENVFQQLTQNQ